MNMLQQSSALFLNFFFFLSPHRDRQRQETEDKKLVLNKAPKQISGCEDVMDLQKTRDKRDFLCQTTHADFSERFHRVAFKTRDFDVSVW